MSNVSLKFHELRIGTEGIATPDEGDYLDGEVVFDAIVDGRARRGLVAKVKQAAGSSFADPIEVEWPERFAGHFTYAAFRECVDQYVRRQVSERILGARSNCDEGIRLDTLRLPVESSCEIAGGAS